MKHARTASPISVDTTPCRACGQGIRWVKLPSGRKLPVNAKAVPCVEVDDVGGVKIVDRHVSHWEFCKNPAKFRENEAPKTPPGPAPGETPDLFAAKSSEPPKRTLWEELAWGRFPVDSQAFLVALERIITTQRPYVYKVPSIDAPASERRRWHLERLESWTKVEVDGRRLLLVVPGGEQDERYLIIHPMIAAKHNLKISMEPEK